MALSESTSDQSPLQGFSQRHLVAMLSTNFGFMNEFYLELVSAGGVGRERDIWTGHVTLTLVAALDDRVALAEARAELDAHVQLKARVRTCSHSRGKCKLVQVDSTRTWTQKLILFDLISPTGRTCGNSRSF